MSQVALFDFDPTLAYREGRWGSAILEALDRLEPSHTVTAADIRPHLQEGFPWHRPDLPHPELFDPEAWWARVLGILERPYRAAGFGADRAKELAGEARALYVDPTSYTVYPESRPALDRLRAAGWSTWILSNHVPELPEIVAGVGLADLVDGVTTSASTGYEKPHSEAFRMALSRAGNPARAVMVGDNPEADIRGAEAAGIPAFLVEGGALLAVVDRILS